MKKVIMLIMFCVVSTGCLAYSFGSNLDRSYPDHYCIRPILPYTHSTPKEIDDHRARLRIYRDCLKTYIDNANSDMEKIEKKIRACTLDLHLAN